MKIGLPVAYCPRFEGLETEVCHHIKAIGSIGDETSHPVRSVSCVGYVLRQADFFAPLREHVQLGGKTILHEPHQKLLDVVVSVLADCASIKQINTRLRPDTALAAWKRNTFADQSTITRVLDTFTPVSVAQLRTAIEQI